MATTTVSGSTVTFSNSGAAANLSTQTSEDELLATFDISTILASSGGGTKTTLYSIDNGTTGDNPLVATNKAFATYDTDLLYKDGLEACWVDGGDTSALGAHVWIGTDSKIHYDATNIAGKFQDLGVGETTTDTIKYTIKMSNGTLSVGTLTVVINGSNDAPVLTGTQATLAAGTEDTNYTINASDLLAGFTDVDGDTLSVSGLTANHGSLVDNGNGTWTFKPAGDYNGPVDLSYNVIDSHGGSVAATQSLNLAAVNDAPTAVVLSSLVTSTPENGGSIKVADIAVTDVDSGTNVLSLSGADALSFSISGGALYFNGGANFEAKASYDVTVNVNDASVGGNPDASQAFHLAITDVVEADNDTTNDYDLFDANGDLQQESQSNNGHTFVGSNGAETIVASNDPVNGDTVNAQGGNDTVYGRGGGDDLKGQNANDTIYGGSGNDDITGGGGADHLWGGSGNDKFVFTAESDSSSGAPDTIHDFHHGFDKINVTQINSGDGGAGDFAFGGLNAATAHGVWYTEGGGNTTLHFDTNGNTNNDEMTIILTGIGLGLTASDFVL